MVYSFIQCDISDKTRNPPDVDLREDDFPTYGHVRDKYNKKFDRGALLL